MRSAQAGAQAAWAGGRGAAAPCRSAAGARQGHEHTGRGRWARLGRAVGQRAVHLVHSACFWLGLTQYCSLVNFWTLFVNPVHEHYSSQNFLKFFLLN